MIQDVLAQPEWANVLGGPDRRGITPLFHTNMTPYGDIQLKVDRRLAISDTTTSARPQQDHDADDAT